jgi:N-acetylglucosamine-6-phosphate deacetylase
MAEKRACRQGTGRAAGTRGRRTTCGNLFFQSGVEATMILRGRHFASGEAVQVEVSGERIARVRRDRDATTPTSSLPWIAPGLVDLQINGYGGQEFTDAGLTTDHVHTICRVADADGITGFCPTLTTQSHAVLAHAAATIARACAEDTGTARRIIGVHLEGPFISTEDGPRGAHPLPHCRPPDWDEFQRLQEAAQGSLRLLTLSPEYEGSAKFIHKAVDSGVLVAIGHTAASPEQIRAAVDAGAGMSTHLGNGAHGQLRRHPNYIWEQLSDDRLAASLIVDGHHLPPSVVKAFVRAKTPQRCVLVSDITGLGGMPPGYYETSLGAVEILDDGRMVVAGQRQFLAGAALPITYGVTNVMRFAGVDLAAAIDMSSTSPAQLIGAPPARLESGSIANLILFHIPESGPLKILATILHGEVVHGRNQAPGRPEPEAPGHRPQAPG